MHQIEQAFTRRFAYWTIALPKAAVTARLRGEIKKAGWSIQYLFGEDERGEYLEYYASHRMTDDTHERLYADGNSEQLESIVGMYVTSEDPTEAKRLEAEYVAENRRCADKLAEKGFGLSLNGALRSGLVGMPDDEFTDSPSAHFAFTLQFPETKFRFWSDAYSYGQRDEGITNEVRPSVLARGFLTMDEFITICAWKTPRTKLRCKQNDPHTVETITRAAFATADDTLKMELLRLLHGVDWQTASTLLHFCDTLPYPILDYRALWSLGFVKPPYYTMQFWLEYLRFTRELSTRLKLSPRIVDRALRQYSKAKQRRKGVRRT